MPVRLFYDFLMEEGLRESNPVGRGRYTPGRQRGGQQRGLVPRLTKLPWIPSEQQWLGILQVAREEPVRNRVMLALAYDAALRREELCSLRTDDLDPAHRTLRVRAETTKNRLERVVPYSASTGVLMSAYLAHRAAVSRARGPVPFRVPAQPRAAADPVDLVEGGPPDCPRGRGPAVLDPHHPARSAGGSPPNSPTPLIRPTGRGRPALRGSPRWTG
ncbi:tyrosine-type recombinase/integrase [Streptomyces sp. NPDC051286]|uniref:tyrosine-type recombinase/integrase n=1 Tax=Streptomyces sp. NPDC051286 TaxID=3365647 RepID=UPI00378EDEA6